MLINSSTQTPNHLLLGITTTTCHKQIFKKNTVVLRKKKYSSRKRLSAPPKKPIPVLILESVEEAVQQLVGIVDSLGILPDDPDHGGPRLRLVQRVQILAQRRDDVLVAVGVLAEDVLDDDDGLLDHVVDLRLDQLDKGRHTLLGGLLHFDGAAADGAH